MSAREGENVTAASGKMPWYGGPTLLDALNAFEVVTRPDDLPLRFPVQDIYHVDEKRIIAGRIESGVIKAGDTLLFSPSNRTGVVRTIEAGNPSEPRTEARAGESVGITLEEQVQIERGTVGSHESDAPIETDVFRARLFWLGEKPLQPGDNFKLRLNTSETIGTAQSIEHVIDTGDLSIRPSERVERYGVAEVTLRSEQMLALDEFVNVPGTGRFLLMEGNDVVGGGIISMQGYANQRELITRRATNVRRVEHKIDADARSRRNGHKGGVLWLTGLSGAGKSTLAVAAEQRLFNLGYQVYVLDGDNVRHGLNADLGFSPEERAENIRRVGEVAALMARAGILVLTAFISPYRSDRERARVPQGILQEGTRGQNSRLHRNFRALRGAGATGTYGRHGRS
jgi:bifunctional enzyme CysN/CysC